MGVKDKDMADILRLKQPHPSKTHKDSIAQIPKVGSSLTF